MIASRSFFLEEAAGAQKALGVCVYVWENLSAHFCSRTSLWIKVGVWYLPLNICVKGRGLQPLTVQEPCGSVSSCLKPSWSRKVLFFLPFKNIWVESHKATASSYLASLRFSELVCATGSKNRMQVLGGLHLLRWCLNSGINCHQLLQSPPSWRLLKLNWSSTLH